MKKVYCSSRTSSTSGNRASFCNHNTTVDRLLSEIGQRSLTNCLEILESCGYTGDVALFVLADFQQLNQIGGIR